MFYFEKSMPSAVYTKDQYSRPDNNSASKEMPLSVALSEMMASCKMAYQAKSPMTDDPKVRAAHALELTEIDLRKMTVLGTPRHGYAMPSEQDIANIAKAKNRRDAAAKVLADLKGN